MLSKLKKLLPLAPLLTVVAIGLIISITNYRFGTYLSGWDTLHPEFNLGLYIERVIFGAWQEHQGLGAPASQAHAAELSRLPVLILLNLFLPESMVRYAFFCLMYILGGIGVYVFIRKSWFENKLGKPYDWAAALGGIFFLLNLGTLQHFYVPLEMFAVHFATVGFVLHSLYQAIKHPSARNFAIFFALQFLSSAAAHTATLFYMYTATLFLYALALALIIHKKKIDALKQVAVLAGLTLAANFFWIGPNLYYILQHSDYVKEAKITRQFSSEAFWQNQAFGELNDVLIFKNFLFNWNDYDFQKAEFVPLLDEWQNHLQTVGYPYLIFITILCLVGLALTFTKKDKQHSLALLVLFVVPVFFINNLNFPSSGLFILLQRLSDTLSEALRFPFTKFSIILMLTMSVYFAHFASWLFTHFSKISAAKDKQYFVVGGVLVLVLLLIIPSWPAFSGNLISSKMKVAYPDEYGQLFDWFDEQPRQTRIAKFPLINQFGWTYNQWSQGMRNQGYQGAGFIWFGLQQPIVDREFDRWAASNEYLYYELSQAVNHGDAAEFQQVLDKYDVDWLLFDESAFNTNSQFKENYAEEFASLIAQNPSITLAEQFGFLKVYSVGDVEEKAWVGSQPVTAVSTSLSRVKEDEIFQSESNYITSKDALVEYPFAQLKGETNPSYIFETTGLEVSSESGTGGTLTLDDWTNQSKSITAEVYAQLTSDTTLEISVQSLLPKLKLNNQAISLSEYAQNDSLQYYIELPNPDDTYIIKLSTSYIIFKPTRNPLYFGSFSFPIDEVPIELYSSTPQNTYQLIADYNYTARNCFTEQTSPDITASKNGDFLFLFAYRNTACATKSEFHTIPGKGLVLLDYSYRSTTPNTYTRVCLYRRNSEGCINQGEYYVDIASEQTKSLQVFEPIETAGDINVSFDISSETDGKNIEYSNAALAYYPHIQTVAISANSLASLAPRALEVSVKPNTTITLQQPYGQDNELLSTKDLSVLATAQNCSSQGQVDFDPQGDKHLVTAQNKGIACEYFMFDAIMPSQEYIANVSVNNLQGKEMLVHVLESENLLIDEVFKKGEFTHNFWIDNRRISDNLQLALEAHSYGKYQSVNEILAVAVAPFPVSYAASLKIENPEGVANYPAATIVETQRKANFWYTVEVDAAEQSTVYLSQTFDSGWRAFSGFRVLPHVRYNSWANAWIVPAGNYTITLFYVPQLLEFSGLLLLVSFSLWAWLKFEFDPKEFFSKKNLHKYATIRAKVMRRLGGKD